MKVIEREWIDWKNEPQGFSKFICTGIWADGRLAYSMVDDKGEVIPEFEGVFAQIRHNGKLVMIHI